MSPKRGLYFGGRLIQFRVGEVYVQFLGHLLRNLLDVLLVLQLLALACQVTSKRCLDANRRGTELWQGGEKERKEETLSTKVHE